MAPFYRGCLLQGGFDNRPVIRQVPDDGMFIQEGKFLLFLAPV